MLGDGSKNKKARFKESELFYLNRDSIWNWVIFKRAGFLSVKYLHFWEMITVSNKE
jgi:hypothetical protein